MTTTYFPEAHELPNASTIKAVATRLLPKGGWDWPADYTPQDKDAFLSGFSLALALVTGATSGDDALEAALS